MRHFRENADNLRDTRVAYTLLISLAAVCTILGIVTTSQDSRLRAYELQDCYRSLNLCADALSEWETAEIEEDRYGAWMRFDESISALPYKVDLAPLKSLSEDMRAGAQVSPRVRAYADTFLLLASLDYGDGATAQTVVSNTLSAVDRAVSPHVSEEQGQDGRIETPPEVLRFSRSAVKNTIKGVFDGGVGSLEPVLSETGDEWYAETENLRMTFSAVDGRLESFVCIHVGHTPSTVLTEEERLSSALEFFNENRRVGKCDEAVAAGEFCGFLVAELEGGGECYLAAVDSSGRVWSLTKVKR